MRKLSELYGLIHLYTKRYINDYRHSSYFICNTIETLCKNRIITWDESYLVMHDFWNNQPSPNKWESFYNNEVFRKNIRPSKRESWWYVGKGDNVETIILANDQRVKFLETLIKYHKENEQK